MESVVPPESPDSAISPVRALSGDHGILLPLCRIPGIKSELLNNEALSLYITDLWSNPR